MRFRSEGRSRFWILTGTGYRDNVDAVARGEVDLGITTPFDVTLEWAREGKHSFAGRAYPIDPHTMWKGLGAPLHRGAERYYREHGYLGR